MRPGNIDDEAEATWYEADARDVVWVIKTRYMNAYAPT